MVCSECEGIIQSEIVVLWVNHQEEMFCSFPCLKDHIVKLIKTIKIDTEAAIAFTPRTLIKITYKEAFYLFPSWERALEDLEKMAA